MATGNITTQSESKKLAETRLANCVETHLSQLVIFRSAICRIRIDSQPMKVVPFPAPIGADVYDVSVSELNDSQFADIYSAWLEHSVLRFRDQVLSDGQLKTFSERFGPLEYAPHGKVTDAERAEISNPYVATISNIVENGKAIGGLQNKDTSWHTDMSYIEHPPTASLLYAVEVPQDGGDTAFCSMSTALEQLPNELFIACSEMTIKHDAAHDSIGKMRRGHTAFSSPIHAPGACHPAVLTHPETQKTVLYLGRRQNAYIQGLSIEESERTLDEIWRHVALPMHTWTQKWQVNDLVVWDNRAVMHRRSGFPNSQRRLMRRTQVKARVPGDKTQQVS